ncbi:MAG: phospholipase D-like domain-containing protein, partial [Alphaproteobacteria bacterium]|nr:phospholipase D-like domain-containing protein [Alphaproteobacteria bacterium]
MSQLINNLSSTNHKNKIAELCKGAKEIIFVSPYLFEDFTSFFIELDLNNTEKVQLITTLRPKSDDQLKKPKSLISFIENMRRTIPKAICQVHINNKLHGKIYIFKYASGELKGIVSSANLTNSGLLRNHEWGLFIEEQALLETLVDEILGSIEYADVPQELIEKMRLYAEQTEKDLPDQPVRDIDASLLRLLKVMAVHTTEKKQFSFEDAKTIILKPVGDAANPIKLVDQRQFGEQTKLYFPNPKPKQIRSGNILITFGTGCRAVLCIHHALTNVESRPNNHEDALRWPWFVNAYNHTPLFGNSWWQYNITIDQLKEEYHELHPKAPISAVGGDNLHTFNRGSGHMALDKGFA